MREIDSGSASGTIRTLFMGTPDFAVPSLRALLADSRYEVVAVATQPDRPAGRGNRVTMSPVKEVALAENLSVVQPVSLRKDADAVAGLRALGLDLIVVAAYGLILPQSVLEIPRLGCVNVHASLLPAYRGASPIAAALLDGVPETGVTIMLMDAGMDTGDVLSQWSLPILPDDTAATLGERLAELGAQALVPTLNGWIDGAIVATAQSRLAGEVSVVRMIKKEAGRIVWSQPADLIERMTRAYQPWPTAYTLWKGAPLRVLGARVEEHFLGEPGSVIKRGNEVGVVTGEGLLVLEVVQPAGRRAMGIDAFVNGARDFVGSVLP